MQIEYYNSINFNGINIVRFFVGYFKCYEAQFKSIFFFNLTKIFICFHRSKIKILKTAKNISTI